MLRLVGFFVVALILARVLAHVPLIGGLFAHTGIFGVWATALLLSWVITKYGQRAYRVRRDHARVRELSAVASPHNQGKLGSMYVVQGRPKKAIELLRQAVAGEPEVAEWRYRLGCALTETGRVEEGVEALRECVALEEEHAYGAAQMRLAEALMRLGRADEALEALATFERNHGPSPESAYRRGVALKAKGDKEGARKALGEVSVLAQQAARYQRQEAGLWSLRARLASWF